VNSNLIEFTIDNNLSIDFIVVVKLNNSKEFTLFLFFFFFILSKIFLLFIKKNIKQLLSTIIKIKTIRLTKQQLKTIYTCYNILEI